MQLATFSLGQISFSSYQKKLVYLATFFIATPLTLVISLYAIIVIDKSHTKTPDASTFKSISSIETPRYGSQVYAAFPTTVGEVKGVAVASDARFEIVRQYLHKYNSPLEPYANDIILTSDKYELDHRLLVAIAQQESNLCKKIPEGSHNCWGWGIHSKGSLGFVDFPTAINTVSQGLKENYIDKGYDTPEKIMQKYTPNSNGSWARGVNEFLAEME